MKYNILIAEDDKDITELLKLYLENEGYQVFIGNDGNVAFDLFNTNEIHLCIFDIMMPNLNGYELCKKIRELSSVPILFLSAKSQDNDKIIGLNIGGDDYIAKPFNPLELLARVKSIIRRTYNFNTINDSEIKFKELKLNLENFTFFKNNKEISLTPTEFKILSMLMKSPGKIFTKVQLYENISGEYFETDDNTMMVHISKLREKVEDDPKNPKYIKTIRGLGYKLEK